MFNPDGMGFEESLETSPELDVLENMDLSGQALELNEDFSEAGLEEAENAEASGGLEQVMEALGLTEEEKQVYQNLIREMPDLNAEGAQGHAKVHLDDCISTTCTYTTTYYSCPSTK